MVEQQQQEKQRREVVKGKWGVIAWWGKGLGGFAAKRAAVCGVFKVVAAVN